MMAESATRQKTAEIVKEAKSHVCTPFLAGPCRSLSIDCVMHQTRACIHRCYYVLIFLTLTDFILCPIHKAAETRLSCTSLLSVTSAVWVVNLPVTGLNRNAVDGETRNGER